MLLICGVLLVTACKSKSKEEQQSGYRMEGDTVQITDRFLSEKIKVTEARLEPYSKEVITSGVVRPIPTRYACIASPFAGERHFLSTFAESKTELENMKVIYQFILSVPHLELS